MSNLGSNIRAIRKKFGETSEELSLAIGVSKPTISDYENGKTSKRDVLQKIAKHYHLTVDELINGDFVYDGKTYFPNYDDYIKASKNVIPVVFSKKSLDDPWFKIAYDAHLRINESAFNGAVYNEDDFDKCLSNYEESLSKNDTVEAAINLLAILIPVAFSMIMPETIEGLQILKKGRITNETFVKEYVLQDIDEEIDSSEDLNTNPIDDSLDETLDLLIERVVTDTNYKDLGYYLVAVRYIYGIINNGMSIELNKTTGREMMNSIALAGNEYAKKYLTLILSFFSSK